jgi:hypothetical protein
MVVRKVDYLDEMMVEMMVVYLVARMDLRLVDNLVDLLAVHLVVLLDNSLVVCLAELMVDEMVAWTAWKLVEYLVVN